MRGVGHGLADSRLDVSDIGADLTDLFNTLTGYSRKVSYRNLLVAPHGIRVGIIERINREIAAHQETGNGHIRLKMNSLVDEQVLDHVAVLDFPARATDVTWIQLVPGADARIPRDETGTLIRSDGLALPIAFDDDGIALAFVPAGNVTLHLAPRLAPYSADAP